MKITDIKTFLMQVDTSKLRNWAADTPFGSHTDSQGVQGTRNWLFVKVYTDEGVVGIGECSGWPRVIETAVQDLKHVVIGEDPAHIEKAVAEDDDRDHGPRHDRKQSAAVRSPASTWRSGTSREKWLDTPVWNLFGGKAARSDPHLQPRQHRRIRTQREGARDYGGEVRRRCRSGAQGGDAARRARATMSTSCSTCTAPPWAHAARCGHRWRARSSRTICCSSRTPSRRRISMATSASATRPTFPLAAGERMTGHLWSARVDRAGTGRRGCSRTPDAPAASRKCARLRRWPRAHHIMMGAAFRLARAQWRNTPHCTCSPAYRTHSFWKRLEGRLAGPARHTVVPPPRRGRWLHRRARRAGAWRGHRRGVRRQIPEFAQCLGAGFGEFGGLRRGHLGRAPVCSNAPQAPQVSPPELSRHRREVCVGGRLE